MDVDTSTVSCISSYSSHSDDSDDDDSDQGDYFVQPLPGLTTGVDNNHNHEDDKSDYCGSDHNEHKNEAHDDDDNKDDDDEANNDDDDNNDKDDNDDDDDADNDNNNDDKQHTNDPTANDNQAPEINILDTVISTLPVSPSKNTGVWGGQKDRSGGSKYRFTE